VNRDRLITLQLLSFNFECCFKLQDPKFKLLARSQVAYNNVAARCNFWTWQHAP